MSFGSAIVGGWHELGLEEWGLSNRGEEGGAAEPPRSCPGSRGGRRHGSLLGEAHALQGKRSREHRLLPFGHDAVHMEGVQRTVWALCMPG